MVKLFILIILTLAGKNIAFAKGEQEKIFLDKIFQNDTPEKQRIILKTNHMSQMKEIMGHKYKKRIFSYYQKENNQVWILNSIGKYKPITAGFVIDNCKIKSSHVIVYREAHGYEIKFPSFLLQFTNAEIDSNIDLNVDIDNISAATLSVNSMKRMARAALLLNKLSNEDSCT